MNTHHQINEAQKDSHIYAQKPNGEEVEPVAVNISKSTPEATQQTAENVPTTASREVTSGEAG